MSASRAFGSHVCAHRHNIRLRIWSRFSANSVNIVSCAVVAVSVNSSGVSLTCTESGRTPRFQRSRRPVVIIYQVNTRRIEDVRTAVGPVLYSVSCGSPSSDRLHKLSAACGCSTHSSCDASRHTRNGLYDTLRHLPYRHLLTLWRLPVFISMAPSPIPVNEQRLMMLLLPPQIWMPSPGKLRIRICLIIKSWQSISSALYAVPASTSVIPGNGAVSPAMVVIDLAVSGALQADTAAYLELNHMRFRSAF